METFALLPISSPKNHGAGVDSALLATLHTAAMEVHINAGGFYDGRALTSESGWKSGLLLEVPWGRFRPGVEIFAKQVCSQPVQVFLGPGFIYNVGPFELRAGLPFGLTDEAVDFSPSVWITRAFSLW